MEVLVNEYHWDKSCWEGDPRIAGYGKWIEVSYSKKLADFLPEENDLLYIKKFFLDRLDELEMVQKQFHRLAWDK